MKRRKFISTCAGCMMASMCAFLLKNNDTSYMPEAGFRSALHHLQVHVTEHCNLSCKYCVRFSNIAQEGFYELDKFKRDIEKLSHILNKQLITINLMGGEPLLNPDINEYIEIARKCFPNTIIKITTNLVLLDDMKESFWKTLKKYDGVIVPSIYPVKINWKSVLIKVKRYNIKFCNEKFEDLTPENIDKNRIMTTFKLNLKEQGYGMARKCHLRYVCNNLYDGKLYPCHIIPYVKHLNKKFNTNFTVSEDDYIDIQKISDIKEIESFMRKPAPPFCNYCAETTKNLKWENTTEHTLSEWT